MKKVIATAVLSLATVSAGAVEYPYIGLDYLQTTYASSGFNGDVSPTAARLRFGAVITPYFGMEAHVVGGTDGDLARVTGNAYDINIDSIYSLNGVVRLPLGQVGSIYAFAGYGETRLTAESLNPLFLDQKTRDDGLTYGTTVEFRVWKEWRLEADFSSYLDNDNNELTAVGVGIRRNL